MNIVQAACRRGQRLSGVDNAPNYLWQAFLQQREEGKPIINSESVIDDTSREKSFFYQQLYNRCYSSLALYPKTVVLGGDHSISSASVSAFFDYYQEKGHLIWIDAHPDIQIPETSESGNSHGMPVAKVFGLTDNHLERHNNYTPNFKQLTYVGIRSIDPPEHQRIQHFQIASHYATDILDIGMEHTIAKIQKQLWDTSVEAVYLSVDVDSIDPELVASTGTPSSLGLQTKDVIELINSIPVPVIGADLVEFNPEIGNPEQLELSTQHTLSVLDTLVKV